MLCALAACQGLPGADPRSVPVTDPASPLAGGSTARWAADFGRLAEDIPRAVRNCRWALLHIEPHGAEESASAGTVVNDWISATALLPNERRARIEARPAPQGHINVAIRVGQLGNRAAERRFLRELAKALRGKPARHYRGRFDWPQ